MEKEKMKKLDIYVVGENNRPFLKATVNGRVYKKPFNPYDNPNKQCEEFTNDIKTAEQQIMMHASKNFEDYMFKKITGEYL